LTNNPEKLKTMEKFDIKVEERVSLSPFHWQVENRKDVKMSEKDDYLLTKIHKMGHLLTPPFDILEDFQQREGKKLN
jgi:GTP cyclohydrolase II